MSKSTTFKVFMRKVQTEVRDVAQWTESSQQK